VLFLSQPTCDAVFEAIQDRIIDQVSTRARIAVPLWARAGIPLVQKWTQAIDGTSLSMILLCDGQTGQGGSSPATAAPARANCLSALPTETVSTTTMMEGAQACHIGSGWPGDDRRFADSMSKWAQ